MSITVKTPTGEQSYSAFPSFSDLMLTQEKLRNGTKLDDVDRENLTRIGIKTPTGEQSYSPGITPPAVVPRRDVARARGARARAAGPSGTARGSR